MNDGAQGFARIANKSSLATIVDVINAIKSIALQNDTTLPVNNLIKCIGIKIIVVVYAIVNEN